MANRNTRVWPEDINTFVLCYYTMKVYIPIQYTIYIYYADLDILYKW